VIQQVEYIEFMKLMGVARFIICDESSDDDIHLLQACLAACHQFQMPRSLKSVQTCILATHAVRSTYTQRVLGARRLPASQPPTAALPPDIDGFDAALELLQELYESRGRTYVAVVPSPEPGTLMAGQMACYHACFEMAKNDTDWFIVIVRSGTHIT